MSAHGGRFRAATGIPTMLPSLHLLAYLDPASGSLLLQLVLGGVAGLALVLKLFWHRILGLFGKRPKDDEPAA